MESKEYFKQDENLSDKERIYELEKQVIELQKEIKRLKDKNVSFNKFNEEHVNSLVKQLESNKFAQK